MIKRGHLVIVILGLPAALLLAFGPRGEVSVPQGRTVVRYWEKWTGVEGAVVQKLVDRFNATVGAQHGIWVDYNAVSDIEKRTLIATAGGDPPDVAGLFDFIVPQYADQGALRPLDDMVHEQGIALDQLKPVWLDICRYNGQLYALPSTPYTIALYYNRRLFREAGLDPDHPPQTIAEFDAYSAKLMQYQEVVGPGGQKRRQVTQASFTPSVAMLGWWPWVWPCFFDGRLWDGQRCTLDTPAGQAAVAWLANYRAMQGAPEMIAFEGTAGAIESAQNPFLSEQLAMVYQGPWLSNWIAKYAPQLDYGVAPFPSITAERRNAFASCDVFVIPAGARHPQEAMVFIAYMLRQDVLEELCREHNKISPFITPGPDFYARHPNPHIRAFEALASSPAAFGYPAMPMWTQALDEMKRMLNIILRYPDRAEATLKETQAKIDVIVREYQAMQAKRRGG